MLSANERLSSFPRSQQATIVQKVVIMPILVATDREVAVIDVERGTSASVQGISDRPTCLAADALVHGRAWCGTHREGVFRSDDGGRSWRSVGLAGRLIMAIAASPVERDVVWVGTCAAWRSIRGNRTSSWYQRHPDRTPRTWLADRMAGCIADSLPSAGSASATVGQSHPAQSRRCSAPARNLETCGPPMSAACTVRTIVEKVGAASSVMRRHRSISAVSPCCSNAGQTRRPRRGSLPQ
jgi:hypothetical protein